MNQAPKDEAFWTAKTGIMQYNIMEMHHIDRVKLQFDIHLHKVNHQWNVKSWKDFAPKWRQMWKRRHQHVLQYPVAPFEMKPTQEYMICYRSITTPDLL